jgi:UV DNA damage endonuclease
MIKIGYACLNTQLPGAGRTFRLAGYSQERMLAVAQANLEALENILRWNLAQDIRLFRLTSDLVPFGGHAVNSGQWQSALAADFVRIGAFIAKHKMRVSLHPGQYCSLNSPNPVVYRNTLFDLDYHAAILDAMGLDNTHKIILHGGGVYADKNGSLAVLAERLRTLPETVFRRLALENDEKSYHPGDILELGQQLRIPAVMDVFHYAVNPGPERTEVSSWIKRMSSTWRGERQKIHYSDQAEGKSRGAHSAKIDIAAFKEFYDSIKHQELDIMLEVKDKQESVLKLRQAIPELR